jgi:hypothetical protein
MSITLGQTHSFEEREREKAQGFGRMTTYLLAKPPSPQLE